MENVTLENASPTIYTITRPKNVNVSFCYIFLVIFVMSDCTCTHIDPQVHTSMYAHTHKWSVIYMTDSMLLVKHL